MNIERKKNSESCSHIEVLEGLRLPKDYLCEECIKVKGDWVHLRTCQTCGATLYCDSSPHKHMTKHFHDTNHNVVISAEPQENFIYCYSDKIFVKY